MIVEQLKGAHTKKEKQHVLKIENPPLLSTHFSCNVHEPHLCYYLISCSWQKALHSDSAPRSREWCFHDAAHERVHQGWGHLAPLFHFI